MNFKLWFENTQQKFVHLLQVKCFSEGIHARDFDEDVPALDPRQGNVEWNWIIDDSPLLSGQHVEIWENQERGSFHEKWVELFAFLSVSPDYLENLHDAELNIWTWDGKLSPSSITDKSIPARGARKIFDMTYRDRHSFIEEMSLRCGLRKPDGHKPKQPPQQEPTAPHQTPEQWWDKEAKIRTAGKPPTRPTGKDGHSQKWDGD